MDPPECPVCLQVYDGSFTTPRVLACGHSACEACLTQLPQPFTHTIRCPACTQLVKYPGVSGLPKNIDLLRISDVLQNPDHGNPSKPKLNKEKSTSISEHHLVPNLWPRQFYLSWKDWIIPETAIAAEIGAEDGFFFVFPGRVTNSLGDSSLPTRCLMKCNEKVSLVRVGGNLIENDDKLKYSYIAKILLVLHGMKDGEREELCSILRSSLRQRSICNVHGLWYSSGDAGLYLVTERFAGNFSEKVGHWKNGLVNENSNNCLKDASSLAMIGMEMCEAVIALHSEGLFYGCLSMTCFSFDDFGHVHIDLGEALAMSRRVRKMIGEAVADTSKEIELSLRNDSFKDLAFVSPELLLELLHKHGRDSQCKPNFAFGYGSDAWSLGCLLLCLVLGNPFTELMSQYLNCFIHVSSDADSDYTELYFSWMEKVKDLIQTKSMIEFTSLQDILCESLKLDPHSRPCVIDIRTCMRSLIIKPKFDINVSLSEVHDKNAGNCLFLGELCLLQGKVNKTFEIELEAGSQNGNDNAGDDFNQAGNIIEGLAGGNIKCMDLKGHQDCVSGLAIGGGFLFSSSFDKTVRVWSLQDFTHLHTFQGHEHKVMAVGFVDQEPPLCISGDNGGGICIWRISTPFDQEPLKKLFEQKDWRYSGIHALAISGTEYFYTGSGDKSVKAWSLQDYSLSCTMNGHKSTVSTLAVCNGVLYSGGWDGTVRLWSLSDHTPLAVLGEDAPGNVISILSLAAYGDALVVGHEDGSVKIWRNSVLLKSDTSHKGAILSVIMEGTLIFTGGWDKVVNVQELAADEFQVDAMPLGSIASDSVITALLYQQGKLFVGQADRIIKVYHGS